MKDSRLRSSEDQHARTHHNHYTLAPIHTSADIYSIHDSGLSSEDGSGYHTPTLHTPSSAFTSLPPTLPTNGLPPINVPQLIDHEPSQHGGVLSHYRTIEHQNVYQPPERLDTYNSQFSSSHQHQRFSEPYPHHMHSGSQNAYRHSPFDSAPTSSLHYAHSMSRDAPSSSRHHQPYSDAGNNQRVSTPSQVVSLPPVRTISRSPPAAGPSKATSTPPITLPPPPPQSSHGEESETSPEPKPKQPQRSGRGSSNIVIACRQCRTRKIRCDSTRPTCNNCVRRNSGCEYDLVPKRRGPDKRPGTRTRACKRKPRDEPTTPLSNKKKRIDDSTTGPGYAESPATQQAEPSRIHGIARVSSSSSHPHNGSSQSPVSTSPASMPLYAPHNSIPQAGSNPSSSQRQLPDLQTWSDNLRTDNTKYIPYNLSSNTAFNTPTNVFTSSSIEMPTQSSIERSRKVWWDGFLKSYAPASLDPLQDAVDDLKFLFASTSYWLQCFNVPLLLRNLRDPHERENLQPSLILSCLALATLMKSSEVGLGEPGRNRALRLRDLAQTSLDASMSSNWVDPSLAQAALTLALFEASAHPNHTSQRASQSLVHLDFIIRTLGLASLDRADPNTSRFLPRSVPAVPRESRAGDVKECSCDSTSTASSLNPHSQGWDPHWTTAEVRNEESRRVCWSALTLVSAHSADCATVKRKPLDLYLLKPSNYSILFPGEALRRREGNTSHHPPKETVWALYCRSMLLWNSCLELTHENVSDSEKAEFALQAWMEADNIEEALNCHNCTAEQVSLFVGRDYLLNTRMTIVQEFRRYVPLPASGSNSWFSRKRAEEWLKYQDGVAKRVKSTLHILSEGPGKLLTTRPFYVWWFMGQVAICMSLWVYDRTLTQALWICHDLLAPIDVLTYLWPCPAQRVRYSALREKLVEASLAAGIKPPPSPRFSLLSRPLP